MAQEVLPRSDAAGDRERHLALVSDERVDGPFSCGGVEAVLVDLEPLEAGDGGLGRARDFGQVCDDGALVRGVDGVRGIASGLVEGVVPLSTSVLGRGYGESGVGGECNSPLQ